MAATVLVAGCSAADRSASTGDASRSGGAARSQDAPNLGAAPGWDCPAGRCDWTDDVESGRPAGTTTSTANFPVAGEAASSGAAVLIDDNEDWAGYVDYVQGSEAAAGVGVRPIGSGRTAVRVRNPAGRPVLGATVEMVGPSGAVLATALSLADGRAILSSTAPAGSSVRVGKSLASATAPVATSDAEIAVTIDAPTGSEAPAVDVVFLIDTTASMADELDSLRAAVDSLGPTIEELPSAPAVRFGLTAYRDEGEAFLTRTYNLTDDLDAFGAALREVRAGGGGDTPEAVDRGLSDAVRRPGWGGPDTVKYIVLLTDAPPHDRPDVGYEAPALASAALGARVVAIGGRGVDPVASFVLRQVAQATGGVFLGLVGTPAAGPAPVVATPQNLASLLHGIVARDLDALTGQ